MITNDAPQGNCPQRMHAIYNECKTPQARYDAIRDNWGALRADIRNENTFNAGITTNFLIQGAITKLGPKCAALKMFARSNEVDPYKPLATGILKFNVTVMDGSDVQTNATDFSASSDSTLNGPTVAVNQYTVGMHLTNAQLNSGVRMADLRGRGNGPARTGNRVGPGGGSCYARPHREPAGTGRAVVPTLRIDCPSCPGSARRPRAIARTDR